jgi:hypothetical protein
LTKTCESSIVEGVQSLIKEIRMSTVDCIIGLYIRVDEMLHDAPKHPQARLYPSEVVTLGLLFALKGLGPRPFYSWLTRNYQDYFPNLPERTRLFRLLDAHADLTDMFLAQPTLLGVADTFGIELRHPLREVVPPCRLATKGSRTIAGLWERSWRA